MRRRRAAPPARGSAPSTRTCPLVGRIRSSRMRIVVDLPAPLGPRKPYTSPGSTRRSRPSSPRLRPYVFTSCSVRMTASVPIAVRLPPRRSHVPGTHPHANPPPAPPTVPKHPPRPHRRSTHRAASIMALCARHAVPNGHNAMITGRVGAVTHGATTKLALSWVMVVRT